MRNLFKTFEVGRAGLLGAAKTVTALDDVSIAIYSGEILGLIGETGSGKSTLGRCIAQLEVPTRGEIEFKGVRINSRTSRDRVKLRREIQMIFQDSHGSLNPRMTVGALLEEPLTLLTNLSREERRRRVATLVSEVGLGTDLLDHYRHQLSGGQRQRVNIARALAARPSVLVLDEPVSSLDASLRGQVTTLLRDLRARHGLTYLLISHDLAHIQDICDRVAIMKQGAVLELGTVRQVFEAPVHEYTRKLLGSMLLVDATAPRAERPPEEVVERPPIPYPSGVVERMSENNQ